MARAAHRPADEGRQRRARERRRVLRRRAGGEGVGRPDRETALDVPPARRRASAAASPSPATTSSPTTTARIAAYRLRELHREALARSIFCSRRRAGRRGRLLARGAPRIRHHTSSSSRAPTGSGTTASRKLWPRSSGRPRRRKRSPSRSPTTPPRSRPRRTSGRRRDPREHDRSRRWLVAADRRAEGRLPRLLRRAAQASSACTRQPTREASWPEFDALLGSYGFDFHPHLSLEARDNPLGREAFNPAVITDVTIQVEDPDHVDDAAVAGLRLVPAHRRDLSVQGRPARRPAPARRALARRGVALLAARARPRAGRRRAGSLDPEPGAEPAQPGPARRRSPTTTPSRG